MVKKPIKFKATKSKTSKRPLTKKLTGRKLAKSKKTKKVVSATKPKRRLVARRASKKLVRVKKVGLLITAAGLLSLCVLAFFVAPNIIGMYTKTGRAVLGVSTSGKIGNPAFTDRYFYACVIDNLNFENVDGKSNRTLSYNASDSELGKLNKLSCFRINNVSNTVGLNKLKNITSFYMNGPTKLTSLDLSKNIKLEYINYSCGVSDEVANSKLSTIKLPNTTTVKEISLYGNKLTNLDLSKYIYLERISIRYTLISKLKLPNSSSIKDINIYGNKLTSLDLSKYVKLDWLDAQQNELSSIKLPNTNTPRVIWLRGNKLTNLDLSKYTNIGPSVDISFNNLSNIKLPNTKSITSIDLSGNKLTSLNLSKYTKLEYIDASSNALSNIILPNTNTLKNISLHSNMLTNLNVSKYTKLEGLLVSGNYNLAKLDLTNNKKLDSIWVEEDVKIKTFTTGYTLNSAYTTITVKSKYIPTILANITTTMPGAKKYVMKGSTKYTAGYLADRFNYLVIKDIAGTHKFIISYTSPGITQ